ncbi:hypothetical protein [uncultured Fibrella sp.]|uniref:hypothetical protein n=1 Tax=uncultured Fibrella sp. TaxID=1284596 RepID=UPI0035CAC885
MAQPRPNERESATFWYAKGQSLMQAGQYAQAYTAFQLARSLGAANMAAQMELAKKRNLNSIQLRALLNEARLLAATDPTQSLRLLEYARSVFPDSTSLLKAIGEVANQTTNWYYTLRCDSIRASPGFTYLLADTDKCRLYRRQGDALTLLHTFAERPTLRRFSPDDTYLFVATGKQQSGFLYALTSGPPKLIRTYGDTVTNMQFPAGYGPAHDYLLVEYNRSRVSLTYRSTPLLNSPFMFRSTCAFSPTGRYVTTSKGLYELTGTGIRWVPLQVTVGDWIDRFSPVWFSNNDRNLLTTQYIIRIGSQESGQMSLQTALYRLPERPVNQPIDSVRISRFLDSYMNIPRRLWAPFSADGHYYCVFGKPDSSLFFQDQGQWKPIPLTRPGQDSTYVNNFVTIRFAPSGQYALVSLTNKQVTQLWKLAGRQTYLVHEFEQKVNSYDDVFSPDGHYLLTRHSEPQPDRLWHLSDSLQLIHTFSRRLQAPTVFDVDGYPPGTAYFSADSRYLLTYAATALTADSLWQLDQQRIRPLHGFTNRLRASSTVFSPDSRFLLTSGNGVQPAVLWNLSMQVAMTVPNLLAVNEGLFSRRGNYLLTDSAAWQVTDRELRRLRRPTGFTTLINCQFSPDDRYVVNTRTTGPADSPGTSLYELGTDSLDLLGENENDILRYSLSEGTVTLRSYQGGMFTPDGNGWLTALLPVVDSVRHVQYNGLVKLPDPRMPGMLLPLGRTVHLVDKQIVNTAIQSVYQQWHVSPAALFARDGRFLLTKEQDSLRLYAMKPTMSAGTFLTETTGWPMDVSDKADFWLTRTDFANEYVDQLAVRQRYKVDYTIPDTPDTLHLWRRVGTDLKPIATISKLYRGMNLNWQGPRRQSWFSPMGSYLLAPTDEPVPTTLFALAGATLKPVVRLNSKLLAAALISPSPADERDVGLLYTTTARQTYLLRYGLGGTRTLALGYGSLEHPPLTREKLAWWVRKLDESQQTVELLDLTTAQTLVRIPFGSVLDYTLRPNGNVWVVSTAGVRLIRSPFDVINWLKRAPVAPLTPSLRQVYTFL